MTERTCGHNKITAGCDVCWVIDLSGQLAESKSNYHAYFLQTEEEIQKLEKELADAVKERDALKVDAQEHSLCSANIYGIIDENVQLREKLKRLIEAVDPIVRLGRIVHPDTHDSIPLRNCIPGIWPTIGECRNIESVVTELLK